MLGYNRKYSYGWALFENLKGFAQSHASGDIEMRGYYRGCAITLAGEMVEDMMRKENIEFSIGIYEKQVDRVRRLIDNLMQAVRDAA